VFAANIKHWLAGFLMLSFPIVLAVNLFFMISWLMVRSYKFLLSGLLLALTYSIADRTIKIIPPSVLPQEKFSFSVTSYNLMYSDYHNFLTNNKNENPKGIINTLDTLHSDILCFQEMYNTKKYPEFNMIKKISKKNSYYVYMHSNDMNNKGQGAIGLAIFSRFPIISKKEMYWKPNNNGLLSADIVVEKDTLRVINFQLKSMGIRIRKILKANNVIDKEETKNILGLLKDGFESRGVQVNQLENWIDESPYPVILAGDLNELPYGYAYGRLRAKLKNSFEEKGFGFGFTYHKILSFLRIDNQFFDGQKIEILNFRTLSNVPFSDHYPVKAWYIIK
jgi:endonuclease/exonuclease/phosphatase family metal-dependent hydrolase